MKFDNMRKITLLLSLAVVMSGTALSQGKEKVLIHLHPDQGKQIINKHIYGHFAEHLGNCIYGGLWVGEKSDIPNINGYRKDVFEALKKLNVPNMRWPGGCFADEYHWMDGIGSLDKRAKMVNNNWGGVVEDNSFGTHEFLNLCEMLGCEPYISGNVGSGTVEELAKWVEYMTSDGDSPMANLRRKNGREKPWKVKYLGVGNESWGCGGNMRPEFYADQYRRYATYCREFSGNKLFKIASGASDYDYNWTDVLMRNIGMQMQGVSLHYYTVKGWNGSKGSATAFTNDEYYWTVGKCLEIEDVIQKHIGIMDKYDKDNKVGLMLDEWGTWWDVEPGTNPGFLFQQNTMRDAFVAALSLNVFNKYSQRIQMANIAQVANVLQSMILTKGNKMVLTPTYHVFEMYKVHQDATYVPLEISTDQKEIGNKKIDVVNVSASRKNGVLNITMANIDLESERSVEIDLSGTVVAGKVTGRILTSKNIADYNSFDKPEVVKPVEFSGAKMTNGKISVQLPAKSIIALELQIK